MYRHGTYLITVNDAQIKPEEDPSKRGNFYGPAISTHQESKIVRRQTRASVKKRRAEDKTDRELPRYLKHFIARRVFHNLSTQGQRMQRNRPTKIRRNGMNCRQSKSPGLQKHSQAHNQRAHCLMGY